MFKWLCNYVNVIVCYVLKTKREKKHTEQMLPSGQKEMWFTVEEVEVDCLLVGSQIHEQPAAAPCLQDRVQHTG